MPIRYKIKCFRCKKYYVIVSKRQRYAFCYDCQKKDLKRKIKDPKMKKLFGIPDEYYKENSFLRDIDNCKDVDPYKLQESLSLLKLILPRNAEKTPGILAHVSSLLADQAISLYDIMVHHSDNLVIVFVINEQHASKARDILLKLNYDNQRN